MGRRRATIRAAAVVCGWACVLGAPGCGGGDADRERAAAPREHPPSPPSPGDPPAAPRARGLDRSNEEEVARLVADVAGRRPRPHCVAARRLTPGATRFACRAGARRFRVDWTHYGTGAYEIFARERSGRMRLVQRGTLTITE